LEAFPVSPQPQAHSIWDAARHPAEFVSRCGTGASDWTQGPNPTHDTDAPKPTHDLYHSFTLKHFRFVFLLLLPLRWKAVMKNTGKSVGDASLRSAW